MDAFLDLLVFPDSVYLAGAVTAWIAHCGIRGKHMKLTPSKKEESNEQEPRPRRLASSRTRSCGARRTPHRNAFRPSE